MQRFFTKQVVVGILVLAALVVGAIAFVNLGKTPEPPAAEPIEVQKPDPKTEVIGTSVEGRSITAYTYGSGAKHLLFVGGMHGGYEWNSILLAYAFMDYLKANPTVVPVGLAVTVIPSANPDGVYKVVGTEGRFTTANVSPDAATAAAGRFNANNVDLNRNFDCNWQATSTWQGRPVSAGTAVFSEPETKAIRSFVLKHTPDAVVFWHSQANAVYASECNKGILPGTLSVMSAYARAAGYPAIASFDAYPITGDAEGWLASINIPAITVELKTHETIEWEKNLAGIKALISFYGQ
ncbi:MAG: M14 family metallopeptidase [Minisyncoccia bacterium]